MRRLLLFLLALPALATPPTITSITFYSLSHSDVQVAFTASSAFNDIRLRYIASPSTCTDGVTTCIVTFAHAYASAPVCMAVGSQGTISVFPAAASVAISGSNGTSSALYYRCEGTY